MRLLPQYSSFLASAENPLRPPGEFPDQWLFQKNEKGELIGEKNFNLTSRYDFFRGKDGARSYVKFDKPVDLFDPLMHIKRFSSLEDVVDCLWSFERKGYDIFIPDDSLLRKVIGHQTIPYDKFLAAVEVPGKGMIEYHPSETIRKHREERMKKLRLWFDPI